MSQKQQLVYAAIAELIRDGALHAVTIRAYTPAERRRGGHSGQAADRRRPRVAWRAAHVGRKEFGVADSRGDVARRRTGRDRERPAPARRDDDDRAARQPRRRSDDRRETQRRRQQYVVEQLSRAVRSRQDDARLIHRVGAAAGAAWSGGSVVARRLCNRREAGRSAPEGTDRDGRRDPRRRRLRHRARERSLARHTHPDGHHHRRRHRKSDDGRNARARHDRARKRGARTGDRRSRGMPDRDGRANRRARYRDDRDRRRRRVARLPASRDARSRRNRNLSDRGRGDRRARAPEGHASRYARIGVDQTRRSRRDAEHRATTGWNST